MRFKITAIAAAACAAALVFAPLADATTAKPVNHANKMAKIHPKFVISKLVIVGHTRTYDVTTAAATVKARVQVKDHSKKFNPTSVKLVIIEKLTGTDSTAKFTVKARLNGKSRVVSNWQAKITVPVGSPAATYCIALVKVDDTSPDTLPVVKSAKGLVGRDCFTVVNTNPIA